MTMIIGWLLSNWKLVAQAIGAVCLAVLLWWFFIHNPRVIKNLEADKAELSRQVVNGQKAISLLDDIQKGKGKINEQVQSQIEAVKSAAIPRRAVLISGGSVLPTLPSSRPAAGAKTTAP